MQNAITNVDSMTDLLFDDQRVVSDQELKQAAELAELVKRKKADIVVLEDNLKRMKEEVDRLERNDLPEVMDAIGLKSLVLSTGEAVTVKDVITASIKKENSEPAFKWLVENNHGDLIKTELKTSFGRKELEKAQAVKEAMKQQFGIEVAVSQSVHYQTLSAWAKEQITQGEDIPRELLGVYQGRMAVIK